MKNSIFALDRPQVGVIVLAHGSTMADKFNQNLIVNARNQGYLVHLHGRFISLHK